MPKHTKRTPRPLSAAVRKNLQERANAIAARSQDRFFPSEKKKPVSIMIKYYSILNVTMSQYLSSLNVSRE